MKGFILLMVLFTLELPPSKFVKGKGYEGYIFNKEHFVFMSIEDQKERYTPTNENIRVIESILRDSINYINKNQPRVDGNMIIYRNLNKYKRQYVGFLNQNNEIVIRIKFFKQGEMSDTELSTDIVDVLDGGSNFWSITVNLTQRKLYDMRVNGIAVVPTFFDRPHMLCCTLLTLGEQNT